MDIDYKVFQFVNRVVPPYKAVSFLRHDAIMFSQPIRSRGSRRARRYFLLTQQQQLPGARSWIKNKTTDSFHPYFSSRSRDEQRGGGVHRHEAGIRPVFQPLVRGEVPKRGPGRRSVHREL